ncbi:nuclear valosin-containing protein-like isoform X2 [Tachysurus fulvidraco]|nr:nuclear valosin-containing protein-like isoform X2 [Tachysurus fulvidraco]
MDGLETCRQVFIMAATTRPDIIDPAFLRPGRFNKKLYVGLPSPEARHAILLTITKGGTKPRLDTDVSLEEIARDERCDCYTGADLSALVREASFNALNAHLYSQTAIPHAAGGDQLLSLLRNSESPSEEQLADLCIIMDDFKESLAQVQPFAKREGFATVPDVTWDDVGALQDVREELTKAILVGFVHRLVMFRNDNNKDTRV